MKIKTHKDIRSLLKELSGNGWIITNKKNHVKIYSPDGCLRTVVGSSISDLRAVENIKADIRRARTNYESEYYK